MYADVACGQDDKGGVPQTEYQQTPQPVPAADNSRIVGTCPAISNAPLTLVLRVSNILRAILRVRNAPGRSADYVYDAAGPAGRSARRPVARRGGNGSR